MTYRMNIYMHQAVPTGSTLTVNVTDEQVEQVTERLSDANEVLRFEADEGRRRTVTLIPVRAVTHVSYDIPV